MNTLQSDLLAKLAQVQSIREKCGNGIEAATSALIFIMENGAELAAMARDAQRFNDLCELVQDGTLLLGSYETSDEAEYFDGLADIPPLIDRMHRTAEICRNVRIKHAAMTHTQENGNG